MKLIKYLSEHSNMSHASVITFNDVYFPKGFSCFVEALAHEGIIPEDYKRRVVNGVHLWADECKHGGLTLETSDHPLMCRNSTSVLKITGSKNALTTAKHVLEVHGVEHNNQPRTAPIQLTHRYNEELPPDIWTEVDGQYVMQDDVREKLLDIAEQFIVFLKMDDLPIEDITVTGSVANFNWTTKSDIDLHILTDLPVVKKKYGPIVGEYFDTKRKMWNELHDITIHGFPIEIYVQDSNEKHFSSGVYSVANDQWVTEPQYEPPTIDDQAVKSKLAMIMSDIDDIVSSCNKAQEVEKMIDKIVNMRQAGLERAGEFSTENLIFKELRRNGYFEKLLTCKTRAYDRALSIEDEAWDTLNS